MSQTEAYIKKLSDLQEGGLSRLRHLAGQFPDATLHGFDLFTGLWWPLRANSPSTPSREPSWLLAKLFASFRIPHVNSESNAGAGLPQILGLLEPYEERSRNLFRNRFDALICSNLTSLEPHLRWALGEASRAAAGSGHRNQAAAGMDWVQLLDDLSIWDRILDHGKFHRSFDVRSIWAEKYITAAVSKYRRET
jgi:hypothetical protein